MRRCRYYTLAILVSIFGLAACGTTTAPSGATPVPEATERTLNMAADQPTSAPAPSASATTPTSTIAMNTPAPTETPVTTEKAEVAGAATDTPTRVRASGSDQLQPATPKPPTEVVPSTIEAPTEQHEAATGSVETSVTLAATRAPIAPISTLVPEQPLIAAEDGQVVHLKVGEIFEFNPGSGSGWTVKIGNEQIITPVAGTPGSYKALMPGETALVATRNPTCRQTKPGCMMPTIVLHIKIVVQ